MADQKLKTRVASVLEDPGAQSIARSYAAAFLNAAETVGVDTSVEEFSSFVDDVLEAQPDFYAILLSANVSREEKIGVIDRAIVPGASEFFANFLKVLANHDRLSLIPLIRREAVVQREKAQGKRRVTVTSAVELDETAHNKVREQLDQHLPFDPIIESVVDPSLIGGLVIQVGDTIYDSSLRTRMKQLRASLRTRTLNEIQSGRNRFSHSEGN